MPTPTPYHGYAVKQTQHNHERSDGKLRQDDRLVRDIYLFQVKSPAESKSKDDIYKLLATVPGDEAYRPLKDGKCPFVKG